MKKIDTAHRDAVLAQAVDDGRILSASKEAYADRWAADPKGTEILLAELAAFPGINDSQPDEEPIDQAAVAAWFPAAAGPLD